MRFLLALMLAICAHTQIDAGKWMIKEYTNINHYPRRDFEFIETHTKDTVFTPFNYAQFGWSVDIFNVSVIDVSNKGSEPGNKTVEANTINWHFNEAFYIEIDFSYAHNLGVLIMTGKGKVFLHCDDATYSMHVTNNDIKPTIFCANWLYKDLTITKGTGWESIKEHILKTLNSKSIIQKAFENKFASTLEIYYHEDYRDKTGLLMFTDMKTKFNILFSWMTAKTNPADKTLDLTYEMKLLESPIIDIANIGQPYTRKPKEDGEYSRMYFIDKKIILEAANIILPKYINQPIYSNDVPKDSYWELQLWNLQKVLPDLLYQRISEVEKFHIIINYNVAESKPALNVFTHFEDYPYYNISGLIFDVQLVLDVPTTPLLNVKCEIWSLLAPVVTEAPSNNLITTSFQAIRGDAIALKYEDKTGGIILNERGLDEFIDEGINDYFIRQLGHYAFGSGIQFQDFAHKGGVQSVETHEDGVYIYLGDL